MTNTMTGAELLLKALVDQGVEVVFGYPGGAVLNIYDELFKQTKLRHINVRHEQGAVHAAEGYARSTGKVGVVLVTSGPGATNTVTGLADAMMDSIPLVCLTGQVPTHMIGNDAFQEADITGITRPCTKHNYLVKDINDLTAKVHEAFYVATTGRPGPVLIDLPKDILAAPGPYVGPSKAKHKSYAPRTKGDAKAIERLAEAMTKAKRPVLYGGGGLINAGPKASELLTKLAHMTGFPVTLTLMGLGAFPASDPQFLGMLGMHGTYEANMAMHDCDLMINIGARFDDRVTSNPKFFSPESTKVHIDIDPSSINKSIHVDWSIIGDAASVLEDLIAVWKDKKLSANKKAVDKWWAEIEHWRTTNCLAYKQSGKIIKPQHAIRRLHALTRKREVFITTEVGQHQMWTAQHFGFDLPNHLMTSGGLGTMGYGFPSAMGVQVAHPDALVVAIAGESSIMMNIQELATMVRYKLPVKTMILNNKYMGMVRQWQELLYGGRYSQSHTDHEPDFVKLAEAFGAIGMEVSDPAKLDGAIQAMIDAPGPVLMNVNVDPSENCFPMIPPGAAHNEMLLGPGEVEDDGGEEDDGMVLV